MIRALLCAGLLAGCVSLTSCADGVVACTDGVSTIIISQELLDTASDEDIALVVLHEAAHIVLRHRDRQIQIGTRLEKEADQWALRMLGPNFDPCPAARLLRGLGQGGRADLLCKEG